MKKNIEYYYQLIDKYERYTKYPDTKTLLNWNFGKIDAAVLIQEYLDAAVWEWRNLEAKIKINKNVQKVSPWFYVKQWNLIILWKKWIYN